MKTGFYLIAFFLLFFTGKISSQEKGQGKGTTKNYGTLRAADGSSTDVEISNMPSNASPSSKSSKSSNSAMEFGRAAGQYNREGFNNIEKSRSKVSSDLRKSKYNKQAVENAADYNNAAIQNQRNNGYNSERKNRFTSFNNRTDAAFEYFSKLELQAGNINTSAKGNAVQRAQSLANRGAAAQNTTAARVLSVASANAMLSSDVGFDKNDLFKHNIEISIFKQLSPEQKKEKYNSTLYELENKEKEIKKINVEYNELHANYEIVKNFFTSAPNPQKEREIQEKFESKKRDLEEKHKAAEQGKVDLLKLIKEEGDICPGCKK